MKTNAKIRDQYCSEHEIDDRRGDVLNCTSSTNDINY